MSRAKPTPPRLPQRILRGFLKPDLWEEVQGDLEENYDHLSNTGSYLKADLNYWFQTINYLRPFAIRSDLLTYLNPFFMWRHNLVISWRNFKANAGYGSLNIIGLAAGLTCVMLIAIFVRFEYSYDTFHTHHDHIYRIAKEDPGNFYLGKNQFAVTPAPLVTSLPQEFPEVLFATQLRRNKILLTGNTVRDLEQGIYATKDFFKVFTFPLLQGDSTTCLEHPKSIVLSKSIAAKYFPDTDPIGQSISLKIQDENSDFQVVAVMKNVPHNSHLQFSYVIPIVNTPYHKSNLDNWDSSSYLTYARLRSDHEKSAFAKKLTDLAREKLKEYQYYKENPESISQYFPQALNDIHLRSHINFEFGANGDIRYVKLFSSVALLILLIACINFINLTTAKAQLRKQEVRVRKIIGAQRSQLFAQLLGESMLPALLATVLALLLTIAALPFLQQLTDRDIGTEFLQKENLIVLLLLVGLSIGILAAIYPAHQIAKQSTSKDSNTINKGKYRLRNALVVIQFAITIPLIVATLVIQNQLRFIHESDSGMSRDHVIAVDLSDQKLIEKYDALREELTSHPGIQQVSASASLPTSIRSQSGTSKWEGAQAGEKISVYHMGVKPGFVDLLGLNLVKGKDMSFDNLEKEREEILVNQSLARQLGWEDPVGKWIDLNGRESRVVGVLSDFNFLPFTQPMAPLALYQDYNYLNYLLVKVKPHQIKSVVEHLQNTVSLVSPSALFKYEFLDDATKQMYSNVVRLSSLFKYFTALALMLASLGLIGLAAFMASQRTKEIGIRKVLGASTFTILSLLNKDFLKLVLIGYGIALPLAWYGCNQWLQDFAFRIDLSWWLFALAGLSAMGIAILAVSSQSLRAAIADPIEAIKQDV